MKNREKKKKTEISMPNWCPSIPTSTLNVNGQNLPIKRQRLIKWIKILSNFMQPTKKSLQM